MSARKPRVLKTSEIVQVFRDLKDNKDQRFCFLVGAGASIGAEIPGAAVLAKGWLADIVKFLPADTYRTWFKEKFERDPPQELKELDAETVASHYPAIFERRFQNFRPAGFRALETAMAGKEPDIGYALFATLLVHTQHKFVITTNFDPLVESALWMYSKERPHVCGHESLAAYVQANVQRPTVVKVHRDLFLDPFNTPDTVDKLKKEWAAALAPLLAACPLLVVGYGGNDGSLMDYLSSLATRQPIYWCRRGPKPLPQQAEKLLKDTDFIVEIDGFTELMVQLASALDLKAHILGNDGIDKDPIVIIAKNRAEGFRASFEKMQERLATDPSKNANPVEQQALAIAIKKLDAEGPAATRKWSFWWDVQTDVNAAIDSDAKDRIYRKGVTQFPNSPALAGNYALFLTDIRRDHEGAERLYRRALELDPNQANHTGNYAHFLRKIRQDHDGAERLYRRALELDPNQANHNGNYANFLTGIRQDHEGAERLYRRAMELDPNDADNTGYYAGFLCGRGRTKEALPLLRRARELAPAGQRGLLAEIAFYELAHVPDRRTQAKQELTALLDAGVRSPGWNLADNLRQAEKEGYSDMAELRALAERLTGRQYAKDQPPTPVPVPKPARKPRRKKAP